MFFNTHTHTHTPNKNAKGGSVLSFLLPPQTSAKGGLRRSFSLIEGRAD